MFLNIYLKMKAKLLVFYEDSVILIRDKEGNVKHVEQDGEDLIKMAKQLRRETKYKINVNPKYIFYACTCNEDIYICHLEGHLRKSDENYVVVKAEDIKNYRFKEDNIYNRVLTKKMMKNYFLFPRVDVRK